MKINTTITTGNFDLAFTGEIGEKDYAGIIEDGFKYRVHRGVFTKTELAMALFTGNTVENAKTKKAEVKKGFKRGEVKWNADLAAKLKKVAEGAMEGFVVTVSKHAAGGTSQAEKVLAAKLAGLELAKEFMTDEQYAAKVAELKGEVAQVAPSSEEVEAVE